MGKTESKLTDHALPMDSASKLWSNQTLASLGFGLETVNLFSLLAGKQSYQSWTEETEC